MSTAPTLRFERTLLREGRLAIAGVDEVGRGALCGPVTIGVVVVTASTRTAPQGVRDSKLLTAAARERLAPRIQRWAASWAVGHASPAEIDAHGIMAAMRMAGHRAVASLSIRPDLVILDGNHDYLTPPVQPVLFGEFGEPESVAMPPVMTRIKADMTCAAVAAASVLAKTARDRIMVDLAAAHPAYAWADNKGYAAAEHMEALRTFGPTVHHRMSWKLPVAAPAVPAPALESDVFTDEAMEG